MQIKKYYDIISYDNILLFKIGLIKIVIYEYTLMKHISKLTLKTQSFLL